MCPSRNALKARLFGAPAVDQRRLRKRKTPSSSGRRQPTAAQGSGRRSTFARPDAFTIMLSKIVLLTIALLWVVTFWTSFAQANTSESFLVIITAAFGPRLFLYIQSLTSIVRWPIRVINCVALVFVRSVYITDRSRRYTIFNSPCFIVCTLKTLAYEYRTKLYVRPLYRW